MPQLTLAILREAREPLAVRDIARRALAAKGVRHPEPRVWKTTRVRLQQYLGKLDHRDVIRKIGSGNSTRQMLITR